VWHRRLHDVLSLSILAQQIDCAFQSHAFFAFRIGHVDTAAATETAVPEFFARGQTLHRRRLTVSRSVLA